MKDKKLSLLLVVLSIALLISLTLIGIIAYNYFYANRNKANAKPNLLLKDAKAVADSKRDSLHKIYTKTISNVETPFDSSWKNPDTVNKNLTVKLEEYYKLKDEIAAILKNNYSAKDLDSARLKIEELQKKIEELRNKTWQVEMENQRLNAVVKKLSNNLKVQYQGVKNKSSQTKILFEKVEPAPNFNASNLRLSALGINADNEYETTEASQTEKIAGWFTIRNNSTQNGSADILVVVLQPDGRVLQSAWGGGTFDSPSGKKIYSCKIPFNYKRGETKPLKFSINADDFTKGNYTVQLYQNGIIIGRNSKTLL